MVNILLSRIDLNEGTTPGRYVKGTQPAWEQLVWDNAHSAVVAPVPSGLSQVAAPPRYTIEERNFRRDSLTIGIGVSTGIYLFTVKGQGTGTNKAAEVLLESIYAKQYN